MFLSEAVSQGHVAAYWKLGKLYANLSTNPRVTCTSSSANHTEDVRAGAGVNVNEMERRLQTHAAALFTRAYEESHPEGTFELAMCYLKGRGVPRDENVGMEYLKHAADLGHEDAKSMVAASPAIATTTTKRNLQQMAAAL